MAKTPRSYSGDQVATLLQTSSVYVAPDRQKNYLMNSNFDFWQRTPSATQASVQNGRTGYGVLAADRWFLDFAVAVGTFTYARQVAPPGIFSSSANYYARWNQTVSGGGLRWLSQFIEGVGSLAGKTATLSFWTRADAPMNLEIKFLQNVGTGGSGGGFTSATTISIDSTWRKYTVSIPIPSLTGATIGTQNDDRLVLYITPQVNTFGWDFAQFMLNEGPTAANYQRASGQGGVQAELTLCQRFYEKTYDVETPPASPTNTGGINLTVGQLGNLANRTISNTWIFKATKRATPSIVSYGNSGVSGVVAMTGGNFSASITNVGVSSAQIGGTDTSTTSAGIMAFQATADAEY